MVVPNEEPKKPKRPKKPSKPTKPNNPRARVASVPVPTSSAALSVVNTNAAGIDVHSDMHMVCVPADRDANPVRQFGANTADLQEIAVWLKKCGVKTIALESTGIYWIPLFELLESEGFEVFLVEPGQLSRCGARPKTDVLDAQWIQRLHSYGLLRGSFRPPNSVLALRAYWRQRQMQVRYAASHVQHMQKALEQMNVKLTEVVSDIAGLTGMSIIDAILAGERNPIKLAQLRHGRCHHSEEEIALALEGTWRLRTSLLELRQAHLGVVSVPSSADHRSATSRLEAELATFANRAGEKTRTGKQRTRGRKSNDGPAPKATVAVVPGVGRRPDKNRGNRRGAALVILAGKSWRGRQSLPRNRKSTSRVGLRLCPTQDESNKTKRRRESSQREEPGRHRFGGWPRYVGGQNNDAVGHVLPADPQSDPVDSGAVKATARKMACLVLQNAQVWPGIRDQVDGRVRGQDESQYAEGTAAEGGGDGFPTQSATCTQ